MTIPDLYARTDNLIAQRAAITRELDELAQAVETRRMLAAMNNTRNHWAVRELVRMELI